MELKGIFTALLTPFDNDNKINKAALEQLIRHNAERYRLEQEAQAELFKRQKSAEAKRFEQEQQAAAEMKMAEAQRFARG